MSTRFDADSSSQIWDHLNALDDDIQIPPVATLDLAALFVAGTPSSNPTAYRVGKWVTFDGGWLAAANTSPVTPAIAYETNTTLLTLPAGWRPAKQLDFMALPYGSGALFNGGVRVATSGVVTVRMVRNVEAVVTGGVWTLTNVRFRLP